MRVRNTHDGFAELWRQLEDTRCSLRSRHKRFCARNILKQWFGVRATDDFIWEVLLHATPGETAMLGGWDELPPPRRYPLVHRELLRAIAEVRLGISHRQVALQDLDRAYSTAFPRSTPINVWKQRREELG